jgi:hypothetical protein
MADSKDIDALDANVARDASETSAPSETNSGSETDAPSITPPLSEIAEAESGKDTPAGNADTEKRGPFLPVVAELITSADAREGIDRAAAEDSAWRWQWPGYPTIAATIALAAVVGALAGAATTASLLRDNETSKLVAANQSLQRDIDNFGAELAAIKATLGDTQRDAHARIGKLAARLDHAEKAQSEAAARSAKASPELITGSIPIPVARPEAKLAVAEGWRLRDYFAGRAVVQNRSGRLFEVAPGSNLPELGRVEAINRDNGRVVVVTRNGTIAAALPQPGPMPRYRPYFD